MLEFTKHVLIRTAWESQAMIPDVPSPFSSTIVCFLIAKHHESGWEWVTETHVLK
jgi:hypothetical protein